MITTHRIFMRITKAKVVSLTELTVNWERAQKLGEIRKIDPLD